MAILVWVAISVSVGFSRGALYAQGTMWTGELDDGRTPINVDYFAATRGTGVDPNSNRNFRGLLWLVEKHHLNAEVYRNFREGKYEYVIGDLRFTLNRFPNHPGALQLLSSVATLTKNPSLPIPYYEKALSLYPQYALTHAQFGNYLVEMGAVDDGIARLKKAIELEPNIVAAHVWLAKAYYKSSARELGDKASEQARKLGHKGPIPGAPQ
jgi:tetratricopeptide (TPR) repeat protein